MIAVSAMYATMTPEEMVSRLLYRDGLMLVIDKPAGLAVHRGPNGGESLEDHFDALRFGLPRAPALAHRLDRDTSGCLVLGRHRKALAQLGKLFKNGAIDKTYWAVVEGAPDADEGDDRRCRSAASTTTRGWWMKHDPQGQPAVTQWKVMGRSPPYRPPPPCMWGGVRGGGREVGTLIDASRNLTTPTPALPTRGREMTWLALEPLTGRTHQLRVHCAEMGWPILGDAIYGTAPRSGGPACICMPAKSSCRSTRTARRSASRAPVPPHMRERLLACGWPGEDSDAFYIRSARSGGRHQ